MSDLVKISQYRIKFLLRHFGMSRQELLRELNRERERKLLAVDVFSDEIEKSTLREIDKVFQFGFSFYIGTLNLKIDKKQGILFRKRNQLKSLSLADKRNVSKMELHAAGLSYFVRNSSWKIPEKLQKHKLSDDPVTTALRLREVLKPRTQSTDKKFLVHLIDSLSEHGILVMEFIDNASTKEDISEIAGLFFKPNYIVLKRNNLTYKSEIFTLLHELGHYLLNNEEIDIGSVLDTTRQIDEHSAEERWCNDFAFAFLAGDMEEIDTLKPHASKQINKLSSDKHLSKLAIYTYFRNNGKMATKDYLALRSAIISSSIKEYETKVRRSHPGASASSKWLHPLPQRPIISKLEKHIVSVAYEDGHLDECDVLARFKHHKLENILNAW